MHTLVQKLDNNVKWWSIYACLLGFFYFFSTPFLGKTIKPSYSNFSRWYTVWILVAALYHLPSLQSMGVDMRMNLSLFLTIYVSSILFILVFHIIFYGLWYIGIVARVAKKQPELLTIMQNCAVLSIACCVFYSHCGNRAIMREKSFERKNITWFFSKLWKREERNTWLAKLIHINELKDQVCSSWFAPVGSASDYPLLSKWVIYGEGQSDEISPIYSLWATFIGLYMANYVVERSTGWALTHPVSVEEYEKLKKQQLKPDFLDMVPWYSGTSADLFKTVFDLLVSVTLFVGRFDMRMMQAAMSKGEDCAQRDDLLYDHYSEKDDLWFDFMADTGDGGNSSYSVARLLAQPFISLNSGDSEHVLPRGDLLLIGGDLAYPNPSSFTYEKRLFCPFEYALQPPHWYKPEHIAVDKPELPYGVSNLKKYDGPQSFVIPGNHDWFDGLHTFMRYICHKSWLGGWFLPQKKSYFALQLPKGWWVFGLDQALHCDIDVFQFKFFSELVRDKVGEKDSVIIMTHEPNWLLDWYWNDVSGKNVSHLICDYLKGRCKLRVAGDLHNYMRHSAIVQQQSDKQQRVHVEHLLVNGCGGAFLHPTHVFRKFKKLYGSVYETKAAYPNFQDSSKIALGNILKFRKKNWQFDVIGGIVYFILVFSLFPQCKLGHILKDDSISGHLNSFFSTAWNGFLFIVDYSYVSSVGTVLLLLAAFLFVPNKVSRKKRAFIGFLHVSAHLTAAVILMLLMELGIETCIRHKLLATSGYHTLYEWYRKMESERFPDPTGLRARMEQWTFGLYPACIKYLMSAFDVPEVMAVTRSNICKNGMESLSRGGAIIYYASVFLYFWVFSTPVVSLVFGSYLYLCINWLHIHFDEAFSSLRIANYKSFTRLHITREGDLEVYTLAVDKVPKEWRLDPEWDGESKQGMSHLRKHPSKWSAAVGQQDPLACVKIVDHFVIQSTARKAADSELSNGSVVTQ
ncbi:hypothetical protein ACHQM5_017075 [Ranunculus cassubicifolius]